MIMEEVKNKSSIIAFRVAAAVFIFAAVFMVFRFLKTDNLYVFDLDYMEKNDDSLVINCFNLRQGSFELAVDYSSDKDTAAFVQADNDKSFDVPMSAGEGTAVMPFALTHPTDRFKITFPVDQEDPDGLSVSAVRISSGRLPIFTDSLLYAVLFIAAALISLKAGSKWENIDVKRRYVYGCLILFIILVNIPYYQKALGFTADIRAHMQRIEGIMRGLADRQFPVIIAPNFMNEFGEISFLYPDIFLYPFGILRIFGVSMLTSYRLCMIAVNAATVLTAYLSFKLMERKDVIALLGTFVITFEPYRLYNMLARGSGAGNAVASVFLPLVAAGIYLILKGDRRWWILSLGMTGVIESHVLTFVILSGTLLLIGAVFAGELVKDRKYMLLIKAVCLTLVMNLGFLIIFIKCYLTDWSSAALEWSDFQAAAYGTGEAFSSPWSLFQIAGIVICIFLLFAKHDKRDIRFRLGLVMTVVSVLLYLTTLRVFPWSILEEALPALGYLTTMLQVPQRVYAVSSVYLVCAMMILLEQTLMPETLKEIWKESGRKRCMALLGIMLAVVIIYGTADAFRDYYSAAPLMPDEIYGDHNSLPIKDYIPTGADEESWAVDSGYVSDEDAVESLAYNKSGTHIDYEYISHGDGNYADMPLLYYEWYRAKDENGRQMNVRRTDNGRVLIDLEGDGEMHEAHIYFDMGIIFSVLYALSLAFSIGFIIVVCHKLNKVGGNYDTDQ